ncbi:MAG: hypothetical protein JWN21_1861 [Sphingomonas bacterium]|uniref:WGxxGxxG family protein n=1 Tax=Sphingomonas bacterium TaxID=1895847 RepID=UPI002635AFD9|nr:WGxxGxxG family protein [Sphingomonas bacterium]MDB5696318.1 hypothetical protein [Sphingomonas bacterium]
MNSKKLTAVLGAAVLASISPSIASAQTVDNTSTAYTTTEREDDDRFPWGLLGLLGLAGLIPRKRNVHVDVDRTTHTTPTDRR